MLQLLENKVSLLFLFLRISVLNLLIIFNKYKTVELKKLKKIPKPNSSKQQQQKKDYLRTFKSTVY